MVREIVHDPMFLQRKSEDATQADLQTAQDLLDTLRANFDRCVGMAANMIGVAKRIIAINDNGKYLVMFNPEIISKFGEFETSDLKLIQIPLSPTVTRYNVWLSGFILHKSFTAIYSLQLILPSI